MPNPAVEKITKILRLEAQTGYNDKAVTRGLGSFAGAWIADAAKNNLDPSWAEDLADDMRAYSDMKDIEARKGAIQAILTQLQTPVLGSALVAGAPAAPVSIAPAKAGVDAPSMPSPQRPAEPKPRPPARDVPQRDNAYAPYRNSAITADQAKLGLDAPVTQISGIGDQNALRFKKLGVFTIGDLLYFFPTRYDDYSALKTINQLEYNEQVTVIGRVASAWKQRTKTAQTIFNMLLEDASGAIHCKWFTNDYGADSLQKQLVVGREIVLSGKVSEFMGKLSFDRPTFELAEHEWVTAGRIVPVYPLTEGLQPLLVRRVMKRVAEYWSTRVSEFLPDAVRRSANLMALNEALREIHWPRDLRAKEAARRRLAFDELFVLQMAVLKQRQLWRGEPGQSVPAQDLTLENMAAALPYKLTGAQRRAVEQIAKDIRQPIAMRRLLQGDVGAGKTVVAAIGMAMAVAHGAQAALMAPTEILAEQHFKGLSKLFAAFVANGLTPVKIRLLTGSTKAAEKRQIYEELADGRAQVVIGTHAIIQEGVQFKNLNFVVVDEQHRFGVEQRKALRQKGGETNPHTLFMTATPIPRTLALTMYGDLDNTVLDEMPPGRQPIDTHWFTPIERERAYGFVRNQVKEGRQAFIICPLVEETEKVEAKAAIEEHERLQREVFPQYRLGLLHGRMKPKDKDEVMTAFARGDMQILVSTSVVEVGIDVPNATVMMIEGANRFGLSQLHQFRGRVGRGQHKSFCLLIADSSSAVSEDRLQAIVSTQDGFKLAEKDLEIRGPGEFFGTRQSGEPELKLVGIGDRDLLELARSQAEQLLAADPALAAPDCKQLAEKVTTFWQTREKSGDAS